ncbi:prephenate dehydratase [Gorillibacterium timonense]|uniref:prephenate dehydratase n=1 Tax=Gorillibacterium timonense TaxID=1689269 RepID=UPI00071C63C2|nr:prephenate dehydratase [Gorillibacterium timonense]
MKRIAVLGPYGTVTDESARYFFRDAGGEYEFIPYKQIAEVFRATANGETDWSVIPIENAIDGSVSLHMDYLIHENQLPIQAEWVYPSIQNLIGRRPSGWQEENSSQAAEDNGEKPYDHVRKVISIPVAIAQCRKFLGAELPEVELEHVASTAEGVRLVSAGADEAVAAIGTQLAAKLYGLEVLAPNITDHQNNYTRFVLVGEQRPELAESELHKTTIIVTLPEDFPGALHQVLATFAWRRINMTKIESRPTKLKLGTYYFYIDVEESLDSVLLQAALAEIEALRCQVRVMGSYPTYPYEFSQHEVVR